MPDISTAVAFAVMQTGTVTREHQTKCTGDAVCSPSSGSPVGVVGWLILGRAAFAVTTCIYFSAKLSQLPPVEPGRFNFAGLNGIYFTFMIAIGLFQLILCAFAYGRRERPIAAAVLIVVNASLDAWPLADGLSGAWALTFPLLLLDSALLAMLFMSGGRGGETSSRQ